MTKNEFINYYVNLLIRQYHDKPKAKKTIAWATNKKAEIFDLTNKLKLAFIVDTAVGKQLDIIGKYVNLKRQYSDVIYLANDEDYRFFIKWKIISNINMDNMRDFHEAVNSMFNGGVSVQNGQNMSIDYWLRYPISNEILDILQKDVSLLPAPMGVDIHYIVQNEINKLFGFNDFRKNTTELITDNYLVGFSEVMEDESVNWIDWQEGDFLGVNNLITSTAQAGV